MDAAERKSILRQLHAAGLEEIGGRQAVGAALAARPDFRPTRIAAVGKAALAMYEGCLPAFADIPALIVSRRGSGAPGNPRAEWIEAAHPVPDETSLEAGRRLRQWIGAAGPEERLLFLISGGASALAEDLNPGLTLANLRSSTIEALGGGVDIAALNARRRGLSTIKGGKLLSGFPGREIVTFAISDVPGDDIAVIGSGLAAAGTYAGGYRGEVIASNARLRGAIERQARAMGLAILRNEEGLNQPVEDAAQMILGAVQAAPPGLFILGGEPTVVLPPTPGEGGRAQALALLLASRIQGARNLAILVSGTDGSDGSSDATGAVVDGDSFTRLPDGAGYLARADSGSFFRQTREAIVTGPTGTNVADVALVLKSG